MSVLKTIIIAEAGVNHNGNIDLAKKLIEVAAESGADYVKFQTFVTEELVDKSASKAKYQKSTTDGDENQFDMIKKLELSIDQFLILEKHCNLNGIKFLTTFADLKSLEFVDRFSLDIIKVSSGELNNIYFLRQIGKLNKSVILSTGMANLSEIELAINTLVETGLNKDQITLLHCTTDYPTAYSDVNLRAMLTLRDAFKINIGYSDHSIGIEVPIAAVTLGAVVIEKHFTLDKQLVGPDHSASLDPIELKEMVQSIRNIELAISKNGVKSPTLNETENKVVVRKSVFVRNNVSKGQIIEINDLIFKRPGDGISVSEIDKILGKKFNSNLESGVKLNYSDIQW